MPGVTYDVSGFFASPLLVNQKFLIYFVNEHRNFQLQISKSKLFLPNVDCTAVLLAQKMMFKPLTT